MNEADLLADADRRARIYLAGVALRRVFPDAAALETPRRFEEGLPDAGFEAADTLALLDAVGLR
jgi:hypothetical protein